tara:strand:+ start:692 stop:895 length:204 start_codon:yes stop_codon:yes gene_type:complete
MGTAHAAWLTATVNPAIHLNKAFFTMSIPLPEGRFVQHETCLNTKSAALLSDYNKWLLIQCLNMEGM